MWGWVHWAVSKFSLSSWKSNHSSLLSNHQLSWFTSNDPPLWHQYNMAPADSLDPPQVANTLPQAHCHLVPLHPHPVVSLVLEIHLTVPTLLWGQSAGLWFFWRGQMVDSHLTADQAQQKQWRYASQRNLWEELISISPTAMCKRYSSKLPLVLCLIILQGAELFAGGIKCLSTLELQEAVLLKHTSWETRHHQAITLAWELKEAEHYTRLVGLIHEQECL